MSEQEAQPQSRRCFGSWIRLPGKMSKTRFDASRSATQSIPGTLWLLASVALQLALLGAAVYLELQR